MRVEQEQRTIEDARISAEQDITAQKSVADVLQVTRTFPVAARETYTFGA
ncbi:hypothetical protein Syun_027728 [Stephania yunnanensis]|uniref:Uncharacterized protein n=1 Tax=Stephania yunnanensis TaxID=152371 RepID=A0AAP0HQ74_9MAGN